MLGNQEQQQQQQEQREYQVPKLQHHALAAWIGSKKFHHADVYFLKDRLQLEAFKFSLKNPPKWDDATRGHTFEEIILESRWFCSKPHCHVIYKYPQVKAFQTYIIKKKNEQ
ncbi:unnamed protein product [Hermetia illucens]|uniref:Uncharacterized protein n=1 Tax=Hermetia illucens TaxID=343691 RepID=A0A7R8UVH6_HERIL|nr:unnamed protein product [Hermetia illucens]